MNRIIILSLVFTVIFAIDPPIFPDKYEVKFNETAQIGPLSGQTKGVLYYDAANNR